MRILYSLLTLLLAIPSVPVDQLPPDAPGPIVVGPSGIVVAGDTLTYKISWGIGARATSYLFTTAVTNTNGSWSVVADSNSGGKWTSGAGLGPLPATGEITTTSYKTWISAIPWDSATFTITVASKNSIGLSAPVGATWRVLRKPGVPGPIAVDSQLVVTGTLVVPVVPGLTIGVGFTGTACAFKQFYNGAVAEWTADKSACHDIYVANFTLAQRNISPAQQAHTDSTCVTWDTQSTMFNLTTNSTCSADVSILAIHP